MYRSHVLESFGAKEQKDVDVTCGVTKGCPANCSCSHIHNKGNVIGKINR